MYDKNDIMMEEIIGLINNCLISERIFSWDVINKELVCKNPDKTFFIEHVTGIPYQLKEYFDIELSEKGNKKIVSLEFKGKTYLSTIQIGNDDAKRARLYFNKHLAIKMRDEYSQFVSKFKVCFVKKSKNIFELLLLQIDTTDEKIDTVRHNESVWDNNKIFDMEYINNIFEIVGSDENIAINNEDYETDNSLNYENKDNYEITYKSMDKFKQENGDYIIPRNLTMFSNLEMNRFDFNYELLLLINNANYKLSFDNESDVFILKNELR